MKSPLTLWKELGFYERFLYWYYAPAYYLGVVALFTAIFLMMLFQPIAEGFMNTLDSVENRLKG